MQPIRRTTPVALLLLLGSFGCGRAKKEAETTIAGAEQTVAGIQTEASKVVPDQLQMVNAAIENAKDRIISGDYRAALTSAKDAAAKASGLAGLVVSKKAELTSQFDSLSTQLPRMFDAVKIRLADLAKAKKLPNGLDRAKLDALKADFPNWAGTLQEALNEFKGGEYSTALTKANELKAKAVAALVDLNPKA